ncbi:hypothetical protein GCM10022295_39760 [Streptomyces osmaniensis]|uniref:Uncharacterized protein n=1 Tax=Streptomyces osmaniensis TaxID=593134 RepID=A0ABP6WQD8_9ACTN
MATVATQTPRISRVAHRRSRFAPSATAEPAAIAPPDPTSADRAVTVNARRDSHDFRLRILFVPPCAVVNGPTPGWIHTFWT